MEKFYELFEVDANIGAREPDMQYMKEELERLRENHSKIQAVVFASSQAHIRDHNPALNKWLWQLRDAIDEADDVLDELEYMKYKKITDKK
ncbi:hypothetical protein IEQ34_013354 [Dendrobium chrysotoxum]|uniref:Disease resistance N-terminal domain-containing protein n=1 Tax=Dendrobium chrysotoxum TaxID=161865 RepID=A0AAV7G886_DENCH|nr:hypothetical protein IEQ34_013354 [Dendrobium chrysotoxum]